MGVRLNRPEILDRVVPLLPPGWRRSASPFVDLLFSLRVGRDTPRPGVREFHLAYHGAARFSRTLDLEELLLAFETHVHSAVAEWSPSGLFLHAGVVGWRGRALVLPGYSRMGKT